MHLILELFSDFFPLSYILSDRKAEALEGNSYLCPMSCHLSYLERFIFPHRSICSFNYFRDLVFSGAFNGKQLLSVYYRTNTVMKKMWILSFQEVQF